MKRLQQKGEGHALIRETVKFEFESTVYNLYYRSIRIHVRNTSKANSYCQGRVLKNLSINYLMEWLVFCYNWMEFYFN